LDLDRSHFVARSPRTAVAAAPITGPSGEGPFSCRRGRFEAAKPALRAQRSLKTEQCTRAAGEQPAARSSLTRLRHPAGRWALKPVLPAPVCVPGATKAGQLSIDRGTSSPVTGGLGLILESLFTGTVPGTRLEGRKAGERGTRRRPGTAACRSLRIRRTAGPEPEAVRRRAGRTPRKPRTPGWGRKALRGTDEGPSAPGKRNHHPGDKTTMGRSYPMLTLRYRVLLGVWQVDWSGPTERRRAPQPRTRPPDDDLRARKMQGLGSLG
jgi:hypothetical protein